MSERERVNQAAWDNCLIAQVACSRTVRQLAELDGLERCEACIEYKVSKPVTGKRAAQVVDGQLPISRSGCFYAINMTDVFESPQGEA